MLYATPTQFEKRKHRPKRRLKKGILEWESTYLQLMNDQNWNTMDINIARYEGYFVEPGTLPPTHPIPFHSNVFCPVVSPPPLPYWHPFYTQVNPYLYNTMPIPYFVFSEAPPPAVNTEWMSHDSYVCVPNTNESGFFNPSVQSHTVQPCAQCHEDWETNFEHTEELSVHHTSVLTDGQLSHLFDEPEVEDTSSINCFRALSIGEVPAFKTLPYQVPSVTSECDYEFGEMSSLLPSGLLSPSGSENSEQSLNVQMAEVTPEPKNKEEGLALANNNSKKEEEVLELANTNSHTGSSDNQANNYTAEPVIFMNQKRQSSTPPHCAVVKPRDHPTRHVNPSFQQGRGRQNLDSKMAGRKQLLVDTQTLLTSFQQNQPRYDRFNAGNPLEWEGAQSMEQQQATSASVASNNPRNFSRKPGFRADEGRQFRASKPGFRGFYHNSASNIHPKRQMDYPAPPMRETTSPQAGRVPQEAAAKNISKAAGSLVKKDVNQREYLEDQLRRGTYECMVCVERVRPYSQTWNCNTCYNIFHLFCISKWSYSTFSGSESWRCPICQEVYYSKPSVYTCFCSKVTKPKVNAYVTPHSCGNVCGLRRFDTPDCTHKCPLRCHPGPCPQCEAYIDRHCPCGKTSVKIRCFLSNDFFCENTCGKVLQCGNHKCKKQCHVGECETCDLEPVHDCFCGKSQKKFKCGIQLTGFSCQRKCGRLLQCGNHYCQTECHPGSCPPCSLLPASVKHCCCGQTSLSLMSAQPRKSCVQPIPQCDKTCKKKLSCGSLDDPHLCQEMCHGGPCPPCTKTTLTKCLCGQKSLAIDCKELFRVYRCQKRCTKKKSCFRHKCLNLCCVEEKHVCSIVCNRMLSCGLHKCKQLCHVGKCLPCDITSFDDLYCRCGVSVLMAPISCGTKRPECKLPCNRNHHCPHPPAHSCHDLPECPPCCYLTEKLCFGKHQMRKSVPCHQTGLSCGLPCKFPLPCGLHTCNMVCHKGPCLKESEICIQPCQTPRPLCGHPCDAPCHGGPCPEIPCKVMIKITCPCKHRSAHRLCNENMGEYQIQTSSFLASTMAELQMGHSVDINDKLVGAKAWQRALQGLDCNGECKILERNQKMAIALQIKNPDLSQKLSPTFSEFIRTMAKKDESFVDTIHKKLTELVTLAKQSKTKTRSHSFPVMNREKRQFIHEYCVHFGCESIALDDEPKRNVVATASKEMSWLPSMSILEVLQREKGHRKVPAPNNREI